MLKLPPVRSEVCFQKVDCVEHHVQESKCSKDRDSTKTLKQMTGRISDNDYDGKQDNGGIFYEGVRLQEYIIFYVERTYLHSKEKKLRR